jgi:hypothetical protein
MEGLSGNATHGCVVHEQVIVSFAYYYDNRWAPGYLVWSTHERVGLHRDGK